MAENALGLGQSSKTKSVLWKSLSASLKGMAQPHTETHLQLITKNSFY